MVRNGGFSILELLNRDLTF